MPKCDKIIMKKNHFIQTQIITEDFKNYTH
jgi:hypothetical protein